MKIAELRKKNAEELNQEMRELLREQFNLRMQKGAGELPRHHSFKMVRRDIARIKTLLKELERSSP